MALERVPADIRRDGGVARMSDPEMIAGIQEAVSIPVMAKARIGHFMEARVLEALEVDYVDESEVLTPADEANHIDKWDFKVPFVCGATNLGEALRRIGEGAAMIRSKGEAGTGDIVEAVRHMRPITGEIRRLTMLGADELATAAKELGAPLDLVREVALRRSPAGRAVLRRRHRDAGRRRADDGARRRRRVRRLGHLQVRGPADAGAGDRRGDDALAGRRARRAGLARARHGDGQPRELQARGRAAARPARLVAAGVAATLRWSACSRCRAASRRTSGCCGIGLGAPRTREVRAPADLAGLDGLVIPGGESTTMTLGIEREGLAEPLRELARRAGGTPILGSCAGLIMLDRDHLALMDMRAERNAFGRQIEELRGRRRARRPRGRSAARDLHPRAVDRRARPGGGDPRGGRRSRDRCARGQRCWPSPFTPSSASDERLHRLFLDLVRDAAV